MEGVSRRLKTIWSKTNRWHRVLLIFVLVEILPPQHMGFHCQDQALSHTFTGDTISWKWLLSITTFLPLIVMLIVEKKFHPEINSGVSKNKIRALEWYKEYLFGLLLNLTVVQTLKVLVGAPRPHFFDSCRPEEALTCTESEYIKAYKCTGVQWTHDASKSFPSGHSSLAVHAGLFLIWYIHTRKPNVSGYKNTLFLKVQATCLIATVLCCISRMLDHRHHWWDVLTGVIIGVVILVYTILYSCKNFNCRMDDGVIDKTEIKEDTKESNGQPIAT